MQERQASIELDRMPAIPCRNKHPFARYAGQFLQQLILPLETANVFNQRVAVHPVKLPIVERKSAAGSWLGSILASGKRAVHTYMTWQIDLAECGRLRPVI